MRQIATVPDYLSVVQACNDEFGWDLDTDTCQQYALELESLLDEQASIEQIRTAVMHYHTEHRKVAALRDSAQADHVQAWAEWMSQVLVILRRTGLWWSSDHAIDSDDLAQIARTELVRALPSYRYQSRLEIWANRVVVQSVRRHLRDSRRSKRAVRPESLNKLTADTEPVDCTPIAEQIANGHQLYQHIMEILSKHPDNRLAHFFQLWVIDELSSSEIGSLVHLHPSRVRALLLQVRTILREHPTIRTWRSDYEETMQP
jgi:RNA polymerase sigma factor (sigma-70 family)